MGHMVREVLVWLVKTPFSCSCIWSLSRAINFRSCRAFFGFILSAITHFNRVVYLSTCAMSLIRTCCKYLKNNFLKIFSNTNSI